MPKKAKEKRVDPLQLTATLAAKVCPPRTVQGPPCLREIAFRPLEDGRTEILATDIDTWVIARIDALSRPTRELAIDSRTFRDAVRAAKPRTLAWSTDHLSLMGAATVKIPTTPTDAWPAAPSPPEDGSAWRSITEATRATIAWTVQAASADTDPNRTWLRALWIGKEGVLATDGHRAHLALAAVPQLPPGVDYKGAPPLWAKILAALPASCSVELGYGDDWLWIHAVAPENDADHIEVYAAGRCVDERRPPIENVIPAPADATVIYQTTGLAKVLAALKCDESKGMMIECGADSWRCTTQSADPAAAESTVNISATKLAGAPIDKPIGIDPRYLAEAAGNEPVEVCFYDPCTPITVTHADGRLGVIMPMRL